MSRVRVGVAGYGVIGQRLADGVARQQDMELVGVADITPTLSIRALAERGMPYKLFCASQESLSRFAEAGILVSGSIEELVSSVDVMLDATSTGVGMRNRQLYLEHGVKAIFQGGEKDDIADVFFHGYANYKLGLGRQFLKLTSCNTTGLIRAVDCLDRAFCVQRVAVTIIRRSADPGDTHRGIVDLALVEPVPNHQAVDLMHIMPHIKATGILVHVPTTHGHIITVLVTTRRQATHAEVLAEFREHPRIRVVKISEGFNSNTALFHYARDLGNPRGDMYEIAIFEETLGFSNGDIVFAMAIPQEAVVIPETIDGIRACMKMQTVREEALALTNTFLGMVPF
jgi:glyceraldehyde-3-phosphate dehydrogenase (NAD(P))